MSKPPSCSSPSPGPALGRRLAGAALALALAAVPIAGASAQPVSFAGRPVTLIVPFPPGGGVDTVARALTERLSAALGTTVLVDNKPGASTLLGAAHVARAAPDGQTLFIGTPSLSINAALQPNQQPGDPRRVLAPVVRLARQPYVLVAGPALASVQDVGGLIAWAQARPGELNIANSGSLTAPRMAAELLADRAAIRIVTVPYRGGAQAALDVTSGRVHGSFAQVIEALPMLRTGARALAVSSRERSPILPDVPAVAETFPGFDVSSWSGLFAPALTPEPMLDRLNAVVNEALADAALRARFREEGIEFVGGTRQELGELLDREIRGWEELQRRARLQLD